MAADDDEYSTTDAYVSMREEINIKEKQMIAAYAASLIGPDDFVYLDAGTTTGLIPGFVTEKTAVFVTNAPEHARKLAAAGIRVYMIGGEVKPSTEAVVGNEGCGKSGKVSFYNRFFSAPRQRHQQACRFLQRRI